MKLKLFEQYNRNETLMGLAKMGLRTGRREVLDLAIKRGLDLEGGLTTFSNRYLLEEYCTKTIFNFTSLEWLYEENQEYLDYIHNIKQLVCDNHPIKSLKGLERLVNLKRLDCENCGLTSLEGIEKIPHLLMVYCRENKITNLKGIENLTKLYFIDCSHNRITDLKGIENLKELKTLYCTDNNLTSLVEIVELNLGLILFDSNPLPQEVLDIDKVNSVVRYYVNLKQST